MSATKALAEVLGKLPPNGISALVVGAGIGGLSAARELWRAGCEVRVLERATGDVLTGDSFTVGPSALGSLRSFPRLDRDVDDLAWDPVMFTRDLRNNVLRGPVERAAMLSAEARAVFGGRSLGRHSRPQLYLAMADHLRRVGVPVEMGQDVESYFEDEAGGRAGVVLRGGQRQEADLVVAADGVHSASRAVVAGPQAAAAVPSGDAIFRVAFPAAPALQDPLIAATYPLLDGRPQVNIYVGPDVQLVVARTVDELSWSLMHADDGRARESWDHHPSPEAAVALLAAHPELPEAARAVMRATPPDTLVDFRIMWRDPQPAWASAGGRVVQLGDAAHTFHPSSGNGATQAVEDAASLARCVARAGPALLPWAARVHNLLRFERVSCLQAFGLYNQASRKKGGNLGELGRWIIAHDPAAYADEKWDEALKHLKEGGPFASTNVPPGMVYRPWSIHTLVEERERGEPTVLDGDWS